MFELSTPFLNIHLFLNQLDRSGTSIQLYNGIALMTSFFCARLLYGGYWSIRWYMDVFYVLQNPHDGIPEISSFSPTNIRPDAISKTTETLPLWLIAVFMTSNTLLNALNFIWFGKMIQTLRNRNKTDTDKID
jgi:TLC domain